MNETTADTIRLIGGHPALDYVNTVDAGDDRQGPDVLVDYRALERWADRIGITFAGQLIGGDAAGALQRILQARERLYRVLLAEARGLAPDPDTVARIQELVGEAATHRTLVPHDGRFRWTWRPDDRDAILHRLMWAAGELLADRSRRTIRECDGRHCGWLFLDRSKAGRRRWCSEEGCGSLNRVRDLRSRGTGGTERD